MIKKILKYCIPFYILSGLITIITYLVITGPYHNLWGVALLTIITTLLIALIITAIGLLFGLVPSILIQRPAKEKIFYWVGQIVAFVVFYAWFINWVTPDLHKHTIKTNAQENEATIESLTDQLTGFTTCPLYP